MIIAKISLAPLASVADSAMRLICVKHGARHVTTEMISATAVCYGDRKTFDLAAIQPGEAPCAIQLFGHRPEEFARAIPLLYEAAEVKPDSFDINMGCPVKKIVRVGEGSALMRDLPLAAKIIQAAVGSSPVPVTVKLRAGFDAGHKNAPELCRIAQECGASSVCVHGRTREDMYADGTVDYDIIKKSVQSVSIPVIANGDVFSGEAMLRVLEYTGAYGIAVGRAALGNPFIFEELSAALDGKAYTPPTALQRIEAAREHLTLLCSLKPERVACFEARKHLGWYMKGIPGAAAYRQKFNSALSTVELFGIIDTVIEGIRNS